jgi:hypothetical protein
MRVGPESELTYQDENEDFDAEQESRLEQRYGRLLLGDRR